MDRERAIDFANAYGVILAGFEDDYEIVSCACGVNAQAILSASKRLQMDAGILKIANKDGRFDLKGFLKSMIEKDDSLTNNNEFMKIALKYNVDLLEYASNELKDNYEVISKCIKEKSETIKFASTRLQRNFNLWKTLHNNMDFDLFDFLETLVNEDKSLLDDNDFMNEALKYNQSLLMKASKEIKNNKDIVIRCVSEFGFLYNYVSEELQYDRDTIYAAMQGYKNDFNRNNYNIKDNVIARLFKKYSDEIKNDYNIASFAVISNSSNIAYVSEELKETTDIIKLGVISSIKEYFEKAGNPKANYVERIKNTISSILDDDKNSKVTFDHNEEYNFPDDFDE